MIRASCSRVKQHYSAQKISQKTTTSALSNELNYSYIEISFHAKWPQISVNMLPFFLNYFFFIASFDNCTLRRLKLSLTSASLNAISSCADSLLGLMISGL